MTSDLFGAPPETGAHFSEPAKTAPLAARMRPRTLEEVGGQQHLIGPDGALRSVFDGGELGSMILWGPPGTGKTTLARLLAQRAEMVFKPFSAVLSGIKDERAAMTEAEQNHRATGKATLLFVDEIHRFNKAQQDAFLPFVESGDITLIGATTENPSFEVIGPLLSRLTVHILQPLSEDELIPVMREALADTDRGLGARRVTATDEQFLALARYASGDARRSLTALEAAVRQVDVASPLTDEALEKVFAGRALLFDKHGEQHFDLISALHKSIRNSDPDAALYWFVRMLEAGEQPMYLARRLVRMASEDIGLADPGALRVAMSARDAFHFLGSPEGDLALAELVVYLAVAPKSNSVYKAFGAIQREVRQGYAHAVPNHLRNAPTAMMKDAGYGEGYKYAHDEGGISDMDCLPEKLVGTRWYQPTNDGVEARIGERLERLRAEIAKRRG